MLKTKMVSLLALLGAVGAANASIPSDIVFDGYCDGMSGLTEVGDYGAAGTWVSLDCAGTNAAMGGTKGKGKGQTANGLILGSYGASVYGAEFVWLINKDNTWTIYRANDGAWINSGTWSPATEAKARGTKPSVAR
jgi:hypothetical protein